MPACSSSWTAVCHTARRGRHTLGITYFTHLAGADLASGARRLAFALPAWRVELEHVDLWVNAPAPVRFLGHDESALDGATRPGGERVQATGRVGAGLRAGSLGARR